MGIFKEQERRFRIADQYQEHLRRLISIQPVGAIPSEAGRVLYDELEMIGRYDGLIFLTKGGVMYLRDRGFI